MKVGDFIPVFRPRTLDWALALNIAEKFGDAHQHSNFGPLVRKLEAELSKILCVSEDSIVIFSNCTDALAGAIATSPENGNAVIPGFSFVATLRAAQVANGERFRISDVSQESWILEPGDVVSGETVVPVAPFGLDPSKILRDLKAHTVVLDAAASFASFPNLSNLSPDHAVCFSLHATKVLGAGEGGFAVFGSTPWANRARAWSNFGRNEVGFQGSGTNSKMSEVQAAFYLARLAAKEEELHQWKSAQSIASSVSKEHKLAVQPHGFKTVHPYWTLELNSEQERIVLERELSSRNIGFRRWWPADLSSVIGAPSLRVSDSLAMRTIGLPLFCGLTDDHGARISGALASAGL